MFIILLCNYIFYLKIRFIGYFLPVVVDVVASVDGIVVDEAIGVFVVGCCTVVVVEVRMYV